MDKVSMNISSDVWKIREDKKRKKKRQRHSEKQH